MRSLTTLRLLALVLLLPCAGMAQAFLPGKSEGSVSLNFTTIHAAGHFLDDGSRLPGYASRANSLTFGLDYGLTEKLAVGVSIPYIRAKYLGPEEPLNLPRNVLDDGVYHGTMQDFRVEARYNALRLPIVTTPYVALSVPSHGYDTIAESAAGPNVKQLTTGVYAGRLLNPVLPRTFVHGSYSYTAVEKILGVSLNRSNIDFSVGQFITPAFSASFLWRRQWVHGGLTYEQIYDPTASPDVFIQQDRLSRQNFQHVGFGVGYSLNEVVSLDFSFVKFVSGRAAHFGEGVSTGISWSFSTEKSQ
jgi:hypothetical protein